MIDSQPVRRALVLGQHEQGTMRALVAQVDRLDALLALSERTEDERRQAISIVETLFETAKCAGLPSVANWYRHARSLLGNPWRVEL